MNDNEIADRINALTGQDWADLSNLYDRVVAHKSGFSKIGGGQELPDGAIEMPYTIEKPIIQEVRKYFLEHHLIVMFDWSHWKEGKAMFRAKDEDRFKDTSSVDAVKLFIAVMRNDRFCDGAWASLFENGDGARLLKRLLAYKPAYN